MRETKDEYLKRVGMKGMMLKKKTMTQAEDDAYDRLHNQKEGSKRDIAQDRKYGIKDKKHKMMPTKPQGKGIVKALGQKGTTGNFKRIEESKGKGAAIAALQNKLAAHRGQPIPFHRKRG